MSRNASSSCGQVPQLIAFRIPAGAKLFGLAVSAVTGTEHRNRDHDYRDGMLKVQG
jgi:hypothetical protein